MEQSLTDNELRNLGMGQLNPHQGMMDRPENNFGDYNNYNSRNQAPFNPNYNQNQSKGFLGMEINPKSSAHLIGLRNERDQDYGRQQPTPSFDFNNTQQSYDKLRGKHPPAGSKIELSRMMRCEREEQMMNNQKLNKKFENFNKLMRGGKEDI